MHLAERMRSQVLRFCWVRGAAREARERDQWTRESSERPERSGGPEDGEVGTENRSATFRIMRYTTFTLRKFKVGSSQKASFS